MLSRSAYLKARTVNSELAGEMEAVIDRNLATRDVDYHGRIIINMESLRRFPKMLRESVLEKYKQGGWAVSYHDDQRDGDWLEFRL